MGGMGLSVVGLSLLTAMPWARDARGPCLGLSYL